MRYAIETMFPTTFITRIVVLLTLLALAGCNADPRIDASSDAALKASMKRMDEKLTDKKKEELTHATMVLTMPQVMRAAADKSAPMPTKETIYKPLHGMTADQIIAKAKQQVEAAKEKRK
jgi:hypothetical protein